MILSKECTKMRLVSPVYGRLHLCISLIDFLTPFLCRVMYFIYYLLYLSSPASSCHRSSQRLYLIVVVNWDSVHAVMDLLEFFGLRWGQVL